MGTESWQDIASRVLMGINLRYGIEPLVRTAERVEAEYGNATADAWLKLACAVAEDMAAS